MKMQFTKMHGCGNDYVYVNGAQAKIPQEKKTELVQRLSDRHFGIGGDGVIFINPVSEAMQKELGQPVDFEMEMYNADGSRAEMCGNGIRCVAKYVYDKGLTDKTSICIVSCGKVKYLELTVENGEVSTVRVNMGAPILTAGDIPVISENDKVISEEIMVDGEKYKMTCVSMGNPHAVVFVDEEDILGGWNRMDAVDVFGTKVVAGKGPLFENHECFPKRTNTEFVKVIDRHTVQMRVWERGTGETLACGTGACATVVACILNGLTDEEVTVKLLGGELNIRWDREENLVYMTGPATTVFDGEIEMDAREEKYYV